MTFYSQTITKNVAKRLYEYFPVNYLQIPIDIEKLWWMLKEYVNLVIHTEYL